MQLSVTPTDPSQEYGGIAAVPTEVDDYRHFRHNTPDIDENEADASSATITMHHFEPVSQMDGDVADRSDTAASTRSVD